MHISSSFYLISLCSALNIFAYTHRIELVCKVYFFLSLLFAGVCLVGCVLDATVRLMLISLSVHVIAFVGVLFLQFLTMSLSVFAFGLHSTISLQLHKRSNIVTACERVGASATYVCGCVYVGNAPHIQCSSKCTKHQSTITTFPLPTNAEITILSQQRNQVL